MNDAGKFLKQKGRLFFWTLAAIDILFSQLQFDNARIFSKPLLMPVLALLVWVSTPPSLRKKIIIPGLVFAAAGDTLLLFEKKQPSFFIAGLVCFLITHILYFVYFLLLKKEAPSLLRQKPLIIVTVLAYFTGFIYLLFPKLGPLTIPVFIYTIVIGSMLMASLNAYHKLPAKSGFRFALGALFFVLSDSLLAFNKFFSPIPLPGLLIMITYCAAQYLIAEGFIFAERKEQ